MENLDMAVDRSLEPDPHARSLSAGRSKGNAAKAGPGKADLADLEAALGYRFADRAHLDLALTHVGATQDRLKSYQRLEFLGDRVLGLVTADMLFAAFPGAEEGELSKRLADLVRRESCAAMAQRWDVERHIRLGAGEAASVALRQAIMGDICEAIIGAVYVDGGYDPASQLVRNSFEAQMLAPLRPLRDPKTSLQEWVQARGLPVPIYREIARTGPDHAPEFTVAVIIAGYADVAAKGSSKRLAEQAAAAAFMEAQGLGRDGPEERRR